MNALPVHPFTGLRAIGVLPSGKIVWPVMGGDESEDAAKQAAEAAAKAAKDKADADAKGGKTFTQEELNRIVGERVSREQDKYKDVDLTALQAAAAELAQIKEANKTETEKALDAARKEAADATRKTVLSEVGGQLVEAAFTAGFAGRLEADKANVLIGNLDKKSFLTAEGTVDHDKVKSLVDSLAPATDGKAPKLTPGQLGQGGNSSGDGKGTASGATLYAQRHAKKNS